MDQLNIDFPFLERLKKIIYFYEEKIPESMHYYYTEILNGNNLELYMQTYSLSKEDLMKFAKVCKIMDIYKELMELIGILESEMSILENSEFEDYKSLMIELQGTGEAYIDGISLSEETEGETISYEAANILIYPEFIEESRQRTINAHSGREEQTQRSIANTIEQLRKAKYLNLRKKGYIHQILNTDNNKPCYLDGNAFERIGRGTTKVNYIRIPISENNRVEIKNTLGIDFDTLYLIVCYGDFKNEGYDEKQYYVEVFNDFKKHYDELLFIINIFKFDFTPKTRPIAMDLIGSGFKVTDDIISVLKNIQR